MNNYEETLTRMRLANPAPEVDTDELAMLRAAIDEEIAELDARSNRRQVAEKPAGWRFRPVVVTALAALVVLALFLPLRYIGERADTGAPATTTLSPSTVASPTTPPTSLAPPVSPLSVDPRDLQWRRVDMPGLSGKYLWFDSVIAGGPGLIAVGSSNGPDASFIWTSPDGVEWSPATIEMDRGSGWAFDVTEGGPGYVAVGSSIWTSSDGIAWQEAELEDPIIGELRAVTVGGPGMVAMGRFGDDSPAVYTSTDGLTWSISPSGSVPMGDNEVTDIVGGGPGLVAVGHVGGIGAIWTSSDGTDWTRIPHDPSVFGYGSEGTELFSIAADESGFIAVGRVTDDGMKGIWRSDNGLDWSVVPLDPNVINDSHELRTVISTEQGYIAAGAGSDRHAWVWFSEDGLTWAQLTGEAFAGVDTEYISDLTVLGDRVIAVGVRYFKTGGSGEDRTGDSEVVWIGESKEE